MEIRRAKREDVPRLVLLGEEFANLSQHIHKFEVSKERIIEFTNEVVNSDQYVVLVLIDNSKIQGFIAGVIHQIYFSKDVALQELAWYVRPRVKGLGLLLEFEKVAKQIGCHKMVVGNKPQYFDLGKVYLRRGYSLLEQHYVKHIGE